MGYGVGSLGFALYVLGAPTEYRIIRIINYIRFIYFQFTELKVCERVNTGT